MKEAIPECEGDAESLHRRLIRVELIESGAIDGIVNLNVFDGDDIDTNELTNEGDINDESSTVALTMYGE